MVDLGSLEPTETIAVQGLSYTYRQCLDQAHANIKACQRARQSCKKGDNMHECENCGQACDCDGEDTWLNAPDDCSHDCEDLDEDDYTDDAEWQANEDGLPLTIRLNHIALGADSHTVCSACKRGEHWDCNLATWCTCDDPTDGDEEAQYYESDPYP